MDPRISVAISMHANKGVYAVLLGSGISREAGIPTGWGIILDLIERVALLEGAEVESAADPEGWYRQRFCEEPNYSALLVQVAASPAERQQLLREFFEPTEDEREEGKKVPTAAHHAIADLVARGYIRVIVTTNFDRLMEQALEARNVAPAVIFSSDAAQGALPLSHASCTIVKVHGDYRDTRILNTAEELAAYDPALDKLLDQIFDEYGLIVSGWSAEWDDALRAAIERAPNRRFSTYWTYPRNLTDAAQTLVAHRQAIAIANAPADSFFQRLSEDVTSLEERAAHHDLTPDLAARTVKRYLPDPMQRIRLHDLIMTEVNRVREVVTTSDEFSVNGPYSGEVLDQRMRQMEEESGTLMAMYAAAGFWTDESNREPWLRGLQTLASIPHPPGTYLPPYDTLRRYPALLAAYAAGVAAVARNNLDFLIAMFTEPMIPVLNYPDPVPIVRFINTSGVLDYDHQRQLPGMQNHLTPFSARLSMLSSLRAASKAMVADDAAFQKAFDRFEYLLGVVTWDLVGWSPVGCFVWRDGQRGQPEYLRVCIDLASEIAALGAEHPLLKSSAFGGSLDRLQEAKAEYDGRLTRWAF